jgi:hypothetical protein
LREPHSPSRDSAFPDVYALLGSPPPPKPSYVINRGNTGSVDSSTQQRRPTVLEHRQTPDHNHLQKRDDHGCLTVYTTRAFCRGTLCVFQLPFTSEAEITTSPEGRRPHPNTALAARNEASCGKKHPPNAIVEPHGPMARPRWICDRNNGRCRNRGRTSGHRDCIERIKRCGSPSTSASDRCSSIVGRQRNRCCPAEIMLRTAYLQRFRRHSEMTVTHCVAIHRSLCRHTRHHPSQHQPGG